MQNISSLNINIWVRLYFSGILGWNCWWYCYICFSIKWHVCFLWQLCVGVCINSKEVSTWLLWSYCHIIHVLVKWWQSIWNNCSSFNVSLWHLSNLLSVVQRTTPSPILWVVAFHCQLVCFNGEGSLDVPFNYWNAINQLFLC